MRRILIIVAVLVPAAFLAIFLEGRFGTSTYHLRGVTYAVPHAYEFSRQFHLPWLNDVEGLAQEPDESIWLIIPAAELAAGIPGYHRYYNGAVGQVEAAMVVAIRTDAGAREFARLRQRNWEDVAARLAEGADLRPDTSGLLRLGRRRMAVEASICSRTRRLSVLGGRRSRRPAWLISILIDRSATDAANSCIATHNV